MGGGLSERRSPAQWICLVAGLLLAARGAAGLVTEPAFALPGEGWHSVVHLGSGVILLSCSARADLAGWGAFAFGVFYAALAAFGAADGDDVLGVIPVQNADHIVHSAYAAAGFLGAAVWFRARRRAKATTGARA